MASVQNEARGVQNRAVARPVMLVAPKGASRMGENMGPMGLMGPMGCGCAGRQRMGSMGSMGVQNPIGPIVPLCGAGVQNVQDQLVFGFILTTDF